MKKKILLLLLCMLMIVPLFVVGASAESFTEGFEDGMFHRGTYDPYVMNPAGDIKVTWYLESTIGLPDMNSDPYIGTSEQMAFIQFTRNREDVPMVLEVLYVSEGVHYKYFLESYNLVFYYGGNPANRHECLIRVFNYDQQVGSNTLTPVLECTPGDCLLMNPNAWDFDMTFPLYDSSQFNNRAIIGFYFNPMDAGTMNSSHMKGLKDFLRCFSLNPQFTYYYDVSVPYNEGWSDGWEEGFDYGVSSGRDDAISTYDGVSLMISTIFEAPFRFLSSFMNVSLFGVNVFGVVSLIISIALIWFVIKIVIKVVGHFRS